MTFGTHFNTPISLKTKYLERPRGIILFLSALKLVSLRIHRDLLGRGFTLPELLTALAIVAVLAGLLLPGLSKARQKAQRLYCANNLRQVGVGYAIYLDDFDLAFPGSGHGVLKHDWLFYEAHRKQPWFARGERNRGVIHELLGTGSSNTFRCPTDLNAQKRETARPGVDGVTSFVYIGFPFSYSLTDLRMGDFFRGAWRGVLYHPGLASFSPELRFRASSVWNPSAKIMVLEENTEGPESSGGDYEGGSWVPWDDPNGMTSRHGGRGNMVMIDGHVESQKPSYALRPEHCSPRYAP